MGIIKQGILGGFANKTGSVVGAYHRGQDTIRALPRNSGKAPSQAQKDQRLKFGLVTGFLGRISNLIDNGYAAAGAKITTAMNEAVSLHLKSAVTGLSPNFTFNYAKLIFSKGKLLMAQSVLADSIAGGKVKFSWDHVEQDDKLIDGTDLVTILIYNPAKDRFVSVRDAVARSAKSYSMSIPADFSLDDVHCYISFSSVKKRNLVSDSLYVGLLPVV
ncbi:DUF6266 family protein [Pedobacter sp. MC2016-24]|uniref:DUF6266 family protein n=1 Tax=Pedobacter sp. MC2016-24 TaxID=2780090 RepID=UPI001880B964|nr:DUF6266 family protein [Pedobacter sp. MC2016-24]MBE9601874.1 hypothetical protein [Pedobacter sp. MC2016-24]